MILSKSQTNKKAKGASYMQRHWTLYAMLILPILYFLIFSYLPMVNLQLAWRANNVIANVWDVRWVGWENFERAFNNPFFINAIRNTLMFSFLDLVVGFPAPIILALLLNELKMPKFKKVTQTISYMPFFLSWVIIGGLVTRLFATSYGTINILLQNAGFERIPFLIDNRNWAIVNVLTNIWRGVGWNTIIYLAAITNVNPELYEAADMDGASRLRKMWHVTLPGIRPVMVIILILTLGHIMGADLARFFTFDNALVRGLNGVAEVIPTFIFRQGLTNFALGAAVGIFQSVIGMVLLLTANWGAKKLGSHGFW